MGNTLLGGVETGDTLLGGWRWEDQTVKRVETEGIVQNE